MKEKLNFSDKTIKSFNLNGKNLFSLDENGIEELKELNKEEKEKLRKYLNVENPNKIEEKQRNKITNKTPKEELKAFFRQYLSLKEENYILINETEIDKLPELAKEEKDILKQFLKNQKEKKELIKSNDRPKDKTKSTNIDINIDEDNNQNKLKTSVINKEVPSLQKDNSNQPKYNKGVKEESVEKEIKSDKIEFYNFAYYAVELINIKSKFSIFFSLSIQDKYYKNVELAAYLDLSKFFSFSFSCVNYKFRIIHEQKMTTIKGEPIKCFIIQVPLQKQIKELSIILLNHVGEKIIEYKSSINIKEPSENYFFLYNLQFNNTKYTPIIDLFPNTIFSNFFNFFFNKESKIENIFQENILYYVVDRISCSKKIELKAETILKIFKYCLKFNLEPKNIQAIDILQDNNYNKNVLNPDFCLLNDDIQNLMLKNQRPIFNNLIVKIYSIYNKEYLMKLIFSKNGNLYSRPVFNLINNGELKLNELPFKNENDKKRFQNALLNVSESKEEIIYSINILKGLTNSLRFIQDNCQTICSILEKKAGFLSSEKDNYFFE